MPLQCLHLPQHNVGELEHDLGTGDAADWLTAGPPGIPHGLRSRALGDFLTATHASAPSGAKRPTAFLQRPDEDHASAFSRSRHRGARLFAGRKAAPASFMFSDGPLGDGSTPEAVRQMDIYQDESDKKLAAAIEKDIDNKTMDQQLGPEPNEGDSSDALSGVVKGGGHIWSDLSTSIAPYFSFLRPEKMIQVVEATPPLALVPLHALAILAAFPATMVFDLCEGALFGFTNGLALAMAGKSVAAAVAFVMARSACDFCGWRQKLQQRMQNWPAVREAASAADRNGAVVVFLARLSPMPCCINNYALACLTDIPWTVYLPVSVIGLLPMTALNVYSGTLAPGVWDLAAHWYDHDMPAGASTALTVLSVVAGSALLGLLASYCWRWKAIPRAEDTSNEPEDGVPSTGAPGTLGGRMLTTIEKHGKEPDDEHEEVPVFKLEK